MYTFPVPSQCTAGKHPVCLVHVTGPLLTYMMDVLQSLCVCKVFWHGVSPKSTNSKSKGDTFKAKLDFSSFMYVPLYQSQKLIFTHHQVTAHYTSNRSQHRYTTWLVTGGERKFHWTAQMVLSTLTGVGRSTFTQNISPLKWCFHRQFQQNFSTKVYS